MMLPEFAPELIAARQDYLRSLGRPVIRDDQGDRPPARGIPSLSLGRIARALRGWLRPQPARPLQGTT